jgi:hypothetical protein
MLHPVGSLPPAVYWRRRAVLIAALVVLVGLTAWVLRPGRGDGAPVAGANTPSHTPSQSSVADSTSVPPSSSAPTSGSATTKATTSSSRSAAPKPCAPGNLKIAAATNAPQYHVGDQPVVMLQVTNVGSTPCVQDLADQQIELRIYNGESRVWGSHDCEVQPGTDEHTLAAGRAVRISITWSGLSSQPKCAGTRQRVGAGMYTLYGSLSGHEGTAAQFSIS